MSGSAFAPVNIAWIKYMGKDRSNGLNLPANASLSLTLKNTGTWVRLKTFRSDHSELEIRWEKGSYVPPETGIKKLRRFLTQTQLWKETLEPFGYEPKIPVGVSIFTQNNAPAASGIATSASSFAAYTLAWCEVLVGNQAERFRNQFRTDLELKKKLAFAASQGSGSSCRSMMGPWVEWNDHGIHSLDFMSSIKWGSLTFLVESEPKKVSSSEAHERVMTSPLWNRRIERATMRLQQLKNLHDITEMRKLVWEECEDMHALFHTATPAFRYQTEVSQQIAQKILEGHGPTSNGVITLDAGANVHVFFPIEELPQWKAFARLHYPDISVIADEQGEGARFVPVADFSIEVPAKWVLSGEHSVLRGKRAVAFPYPKFYLKLNYFSGQNAHFPKQVQKLLDRAIIWLQKNNLLDSTPELKGTIEMQGNIPIGAGLGSSAALCVAVAHFILWKTQNDVSHAVTLATHLEDLFHGKSSGMDVHAISGSSPIIYSRNKNGEASVESLALNRTPRFEIYDTGMRGSTRECIEKLAGSTAPEANALDEQMGRATELAYEALLRFENEPQVAEKSLAQAMQMAQNCFESWGLVSPELLKQKNELINQGALAVKLTGAGMGGFWVALWPS